ncbi:esterase/lipase family protein [Mucisphaera sp.]|uniref:esterase/lipase family protein n=1 Tax=Mucisphaera sp. TaxID=2913024 RepID=UPI003D0D5BFE
MPQALIALILLLTPLVGCAAKDNPRLDAIYNRAAQHYGPDRNPVIVIPGILGSRLKDPQTGRLVWGAFDNEYIRPTSAEGARLIALPMEQGKPLNQLHSRLVPDGALDTVNVSIFWLPFELGAYVQILETLGAGGYRDEQFAQAGTVDYGTDHFTCFQFAYDWRRDNVENAHALLDFIDEKRKLVQDAYLRDYGIANADVKFDIVAHSMGGLLTRYALRYGRADLPTDGSTPEVTWAGAEHIDQVILVATPSAGSVYSMLQLQEGAKLPIFWPDYEPALLGTMPAIYQLLPRPRHGGYIDETTRQPINSIYDAHYWEEMGWSLLDPDQDDILQQLLPNATTREHRLVIARDHTAKALHRARLFHEALDIPANRPEHLELHLFAADSRETGAILAINQETGRTHITGTAPGDTTVLRTSALMDERLNGNWTPQLRSPIDWTSVTFLFSDHIGLTKSKAFSDNVLYKLLEQPSDPPVPGS